jgi:hypothetical protein
MIIDHLCIQLLVGFAIGLGLAWRGEDPSNSVELGPLIISVSMRLLSVIVEFVQGSLLCDQGLESRLQGQCGHELRSYAWSTYMYVGRIRRSAQRARVGTPDIRSTVQHG